MPWERVPLSRWGGIYAYGLHTVPRELVYGMVKMKEQNNSWLCTADS